MPPRIAEQLILCYNNCNCSVLRLAFARCKRIFTVQFYTLHSRIDIGEALLNTPDVILFDVDGTLVDSAPGILHTLQQVFDEMHVDVSHIDLMKYVGPPLRRSFGEHFTDEADVEAATARYREIYHEKGRYESVLYEGVQDMLAALKDAGFVLCTSTSKPTTVVTPILERLGIADYFAVIGGASMDKSRDNKTAVVAYVLEQEVLKGKTAVMIGDRREDLQGAVDCGLSHIGALYGYGTHEELAAFSPLFLAEDCAALTRFILTTKNGETT